MKSKKQVLALVLAMGFGLLPTTAAAAGPPAGAAGGANPMFVEKPAPEHHFLDGKNVALQSLSILMMAADVASTNQALKVPGTHEVNPLAQSQTALISLKIAGAGAGLGISYMMHKTGHHKAERWIPVVFGVPSGIAAIHNFGIHN